MAEARNTLTLTAKAEDRASPELRKVQDTVRRLPEQFSKAGSAINAVENALGGVGGKAGEVVSKLTGMASLIATGGVLGVGIVAMQAAVAGLSYAWERHSEATRIAAAELGAMRDKTNETYDSIRKLNKEMGGVGKDSTEAEITALRNEIALKKQVLAQDEAALRATKQGQGATVEYNAQLGLEEGLVRDSIVVTQEAVQAERQQIAADERRLQLLTEKTRRQQVAKAADDAQRTSTQLLGIAVEESAEATRRQTQTYKEGYDYTLATLGTVAKLQERIDKDNEELAKRNADRRTEIVNSSFEAQQQRAEEAGQVISTSLMSAFNMMAIEGRSFGDTMKSVFTSLAQQAVRAAIEFAVAEGIKRAASRQTTTEQVTGAAVGTAAVLAGQSIQKAGAITTATTELGAAATTGGAKAVAAHAGIPFVGIAIGLGFAAAIVAAILAQRRFATGGTVTGGTPGRDSVFGILEPGEEVLSVQTGEAERYRAARRRGEMAPAGPSLSVTVVTPSQQIFPDGPALERTTLNNVVPVIQRAIDNGWIRFPR